MLRKLTLYCQLMRLDKPVGIYYLLWPCLWGVFLASKGNVDSLLPCMFILGAVAMRSAGCIINDITDRKIDAKVERTKTRPLASGEVKIVEAVILLALLLMLSLAIVFSMRSEILWMAVASLPLVIAYPWMKRITWWPQAFLGLTFNVGALFGWVAVIGEIALPALLLYGGGIFWTLGYDTIYGHQDKVDDAKTGIKSLALCFGKKTKAYVAGFYSVAFLLWSAALFAADGSAINYLWLFLALGWLVYLLRETDIDVPASCLHHFQKAHWAGLMVLLTSIADWTMHLDEVNR